jgi:prepilin-type N-terminal cleavage/methylation domain-containing protein
VLRARDCSGDEAGFTLPELVTATAISLVISVALISVIPVFMKAQASTTQSDQAAAGVRVTLIQLQHDIQSANPLDALGSLAASNSEIQLTLGPIGGTHVITWQYTAATGQLTRQADSGAPIIELTGISNGNSPVFTYLGQHDENMVTQPSATTASVANCTVYVQVTLALPDVHAAPFASTTSIQIENRTPGAISCG